MTPLERFLARLGIAPFDSGNVLHRLLYAALEDARGVSHMERLIITRGVLSRAHADAATAMGKASELGNALMPRPGTTTAFIPSLTASGSTLSPTATSATPSSGGSSATTTTSSCRLNSNPAQSCEFPQSSTCRCGCLDSLLE